MSGPVVPPLTVTEVDGSPLGRPITKIIVSNGDLSISGTTATIDTSGAGGTAALTATQIGFGSGSNLLTGDAGFTFDSSNQTITVTNTDAGATAGPIFDIYRNSASPADDDILGQIRFTGEDDNNDKVQYVNIKGKILNKTNNNEAGALVITPIGNDYAADNSQMGLQVVDAGISSYAPILDFRDDDTNEMTLTNEDLQSKLIVHIGTANKTIKLPAGAKGMKFSFVSTSGNITIDPQNSSTSNTLNGGTGTATRITNNQVYEVICVATQTWLLSNP